MNGVRTAVGLFTRIPVGRLQNWGRYTAAWLWIPGLLAGIIWWAAFRLFGASGIGMIAAVAGEALLTGGLHWKGLVKMFDAWTAPAALRNQVRRSWQAGPVGVLFLGLALFALWTLWKHGGFLSSPVWILPPLWSRALMGWIASWRKADDSSSWATRFVAETRHGSGAWITLLLVMLLGVGLLGFQAVEVFGVSLILIGLFVFWGVRLFRGMNEDLLFASVILTEILTLYFIIVSAPTTFL